MHEMLDRQNFCREHMSSLRCTLISYVCWRNVVCGLRCSTIYGDSTNVTVYESLLVLLGYTTVVLSDFL